MARLVEPGPTTLSPLAASDDDRGMTTLGTLSVSECERLLRASVFGRLVLTTPERLEVVPVNYAVMGDSVLLRTAAGSLLDRHAHGAVVLLEVDEVDHERWQGWSVVVRGRGERLTEEQLTVAERSSPGPPQWAPDRDVWIRLRYLEITGRKLGDGPLVAPATRRTWR